MKKLIALVMTIVLCLTMASCGKSDAVKAVEAAIDSIGSVTLESIDKIAEAEAMYEALEEKEQKKVENITVLDEARSAYNVLREEKAASLAQATYDNLVMATAACLNMLDNVDKALSIFNDTSLSPSNCLQRLSAATGLSVSDLCSGGLGDIDIFFFPGCTVRATKHAYENMGMFDQVDTLLADTAATLGELNDLEDTAYAPALNQLFDAVTEGYAYYKAAEFTGAGNGPSFYDYDLAAAEWNRLSSESKAQIAAIVEPFETVKALLS